MFAPIYYPYLALIDSYMHIYFLNRVGLFFGTNFESQDDLNFGTEGVCSMVAVTKRCLGLVSDWLLN